jgi:hypothetical protein
VGEARRGQQVGRRRSRPWLEHNVARARSTVNLMTWPPNLLVSFTSKFTSIFTDITSTFADNLG